MALRFSAHRSKVGIGGAGILISLAILYGGICLYLPTHPITQQITQPQPSDAAYLKGIVYVLPFVLFYHLVPFHFINTIRKEWASGSIEFIRSLLTADKLAVVPGGVIYIPVKWLGAGLVLTAALYVPMTASLFSSLKPGPYQGLFIRFMQLRGLLFFGFPLLCLSWYYRQLNELKRACSCSAENIGVANRPDVEGRSLA